MLMKIETSCLLAVDFQERLMPAIHDADRIGNNGAWLIQIAQRLNVPVLASEQYPRADWSHGGGDPRTAAGGGLHGEAISPAPPSGTACGASTPWDVSKSS